MTHARTSHGVDPLAEHPSPGSRGKNRRFLPEEDERTHPDDENASDFSRGHKNGLSHFGWESNLMMRIMLRGWLGDFWGTPFPFKKTCMKFGFVKTASWEGFCPRKS